MRFHFDHAQIRRCGLAWVRAAAFAAACLAVAGTAHADDLTVAVESIDYPPLYNGTDPNDYRGFARELLDLFGARYRHRFHYVPLPLNRLFAEFFTAGNFDLKFPDNPKWRPDFKKGLNVSYSDPVLNVTEGIFVLRNNAGHGADGLKSMATLTGFTPLPYTAQVRDGSVKLYFADNFDSLVKMLAIGRVDGIYASDLAMQFYESGHEAEKRAVVLDRSLPAAVSTFSLSTLKHPELVRQFNQFLQSDHDQIAALKRKYGIAEGDGG